MVGKLSLASDIQRFDSREAFDARAVEIILAHLRSQFASDNKAELLLSGGSTPKSIYASLSHKAVEWDRVLVGQVDERWVPLSDPGSNGAMIRKTLLRNNARSAEFVRMKSRYKTAATGRNTLETNYSKFSLSGSLAILGMGPDGHTAGWFPNSEGLADTLNPHNPNRIEAIHAIPSDVTGRYLERITLTLSALNGCDHLLLLTSGANKIDVLTSIMADQPEHYPLSHLVKVAGHKMTCLHVQ